MTATTTNSLTVEQAIGQKLLLSFAGQQPSASILNIIKGRHVGGITLFRALNLFSPAQVREMNAALQATATAAGQPPLLICVDQEGGQVAAVPGLTAFPGNMALGATGSAELAQSVGQALGAELAAVGVNVDYAPVCDVNVNPQNPVIGVRSFGEDPALVARLAAAMVAGLQSAGVAATAKHFPGHGDTATDSHLGLPIVEHDLDRLRRVELPPFAAAVSAGVKLVMSAHISLPALNPGLEMPATLSPLVLRDILRGELGFQGVTVSDAMNMHAIAQGDGLVIDSIAAAVAGMDLLLLVGDQAVHNSVYAGLLQAAKRGLLPLNAVFAAAERIVALKSWLAQQRQPDLSVVNSADHQALAFKVAAQSITLVRDTANLLPLQLESSQRILVILPRPQDLTAADTSSFEQPALGTALRKLHPNVDELVIALNPEPHDIAAILAQAAGYDLVVMGTINATTQPGQADLARALLASATKLVTVALRLPYDLEAYPSAPTYVCAYSLQPCSLNALAQALFGRIPFAGRLPVTFAQ